MAARDRRARRRRVSTVSALPARDPGEEPLWAGYARRFISGYVPTLSAEDLTISRDRYTGIGVDEFPQKAGDLKTLDMLACEDRRRGRTARSHQARGRGPQCGVSAFRQPLGDPASGPIRHGRQFFDIEGGRAGPVFGQRRAIAQHDGDRFADVAGARSRAYDFARFGRRPRDIVAGHGSLHSRLEQRGFEPMVPPARATFANAGHSVVRLTRRFVIGTGTSNPVSSRRESGANSEIADKLREAARSCQFAGARREILHLAARFESRADHLDRRAGSMTATHLG